MKKVLLVFVVFSFLSLGYFYEPSFDNLPEVKKIEVFKGKRRLDLVGFDDKVIKSYKIALGFNPKGHKEKEGDGKTPEGVYALDFKKNSRRFYKSIHISYPNQKDKENAAKNGYKASGDVMIHGLGRHFWWLRKIHKFYDWTQGCIAVDNDEIAEIYHSLKNNAIIEIRK